MDIHGRDLSQGFGRSATKCCFSCIFSQGHAVPSGSLPVTPPSPQGSPAAWPQSLLRGEGTERLRQEPGNPTPAPLSPAPEKGRARGSRGCRSADRDTRRRPPLRRFRSKNYGGLCLPRNAPGRGGGAKGGGRLRWKGKAFANRAASRGDATRWRRRCPRPFLVKTPKSRPDRCAHLRASCGVTSRVRPQEGQLLTRSFCCFCQSLQETRCW